MAKTLQITARPKQGRRRAGIHHPPHAVLHEPGRFTPEQVDQLKGDAELIVNEVDAAPQSGASGEAPASPVSPAARAGVGKGK